MSYPVHFNLYPEEAPDKNSETSWKLHDMDTVFQINI